MNSAFAPYSYEVMHTKEGTHYRVRDAGDNRVATCYLEENAQAIVAALNANRPEAASPQDTKDAERYRKIKDKHSPFLLRNVQCHALDQYFLSSDMDAGLDAWKEDPYGQREWLTEPQSRTD